MSPLETIQAAIDKLTKLDQRWLIDFRNPLFVTLAGTIDAQLSFLAGNLRAGQSGSLDEPGAFEDALELAAAIVGDDA